MADYGADRRGERDHAEDERESSRSRPLATPPLPIPQRLNRNALSVAAVVLGLSVIIVLVATRPSGEATTGRAGTGGSASAPAAPADPTFLSSPPRPVASSADSLAAPLAVVPAAQVAQGGYVPPPQAGATGAISAPSPGPGALGDEPGYSIPVDRSERQSSGAEAKRQDAYARALASSVLGASAAPAASSVLIEGATGADWGQIPAPALQGSAPLAARPRDSLSLTAPVQPASGAGTVSAARFTPPESPLTLRAGTIVDGFLLTGVNSDVCSEVLGQVARDVYDTQTQRVLLVPKGSRLIGRCNAQAVAGGRMLVAWTRLILPDGRWLELPGLGMADQQGLTGVRDQVDLHYGSVFGRALMLSALGAGAQLSQPQQGSLLGAPSAQQVMAAAVGQQLSQVAVEIIRRGMDRQPTVVIRPGQPFVVFLRGDLVFDAPFEPETKPNGP